MSLILKHEQHKFEGDGFFSALSSLIPKVANFVSNNKSLISSEAQALGSVAKAGVNISEAVKRSNELKELQHIREMRNKRLKNKKGSGMNEDELAALETKLNDNSEIVAIKKQLLTLVDTTQLKNLKSLISKLDDKITNQKIDLNQLIDNIIPGISEDKLAALETKLNDNSEIVAIQQQLDNLVDTTQLQSLS
ncbi:hypothetical protein LOTGIDRAFT_176737 [Lottia gigantea]|uniref:Uncharacterized protein n=1 Tax=Lottia gigantea TaxID=225164 RepID=V4AB79_LOTGI|nr:hypothetical protein LOTGIDRAFT_176737 [Lottia gigantea]ESO94057.1 hypothetical protein LOTGIDRAFT_176737 [Lottia gigantea]